MRKQKRFTAKLAGVFLASVVALSLTACRTASADSVNQDYLVVVKLDKVTCDSVEKDTLASLRATAKFAKEANTSETRQILAMNTGLDNLKPLTTALDAKIKEIKACGDSPSPAPSASTTATCESQYMQVAVDNEGGQVISDFETRYAAATADANNLNEAQRTLLLEESGKNASVLAAWSHAFGLNEDPNAWQPLVDGNCLSSEGQKLHNQLEGVLSAKGTTFEEAEAPANAYNSGVTSGVYGVASTAGIYGDRKAIKVTLPDGTVAYIMVRCGNPVYPGKPNLPEVPTDNPVCPWNPALPPDSPDCLEPKDPGQDPAPRGRAPVGGGENDDPGPGPYVPPEEMEKPPATPRVNPTTPPPAPPAPAPGPSPAPVPTKDPAPHPAPGPSAPAPKDPGTVCEPIPGVMDC